MMSSRASAYDLLQWPLCRSRLRGLYVWKERNSPHHGTVRYVVRHSRSDRVYAGAAQHMIGASLIRTGLASFSGGGYAIMGVSHVTG